MKRAVWSAFRSKLELCLALLVAAAFSDVASRKGWARVRKAVLLWFGGLKPGATVSVDVYDRRLAVCRRCSLWFNPLSTCSSPLKVNASDLGCWCHMPTKARLKNAKCWLDEECGDDAPYGWHQYGL